MADFIGALIGGGDALLRGYPSYHKDQAFLASRLVGVSADRLRLERAHLFEQLAAVPFLSTWPSAANFILCEVSAPWAAAGLTKVLLKEHHIMIKDCSGKRGANDRQLVRIAVGTLQQTERLGIALAAYA